MNATDKDNDADYEEGSFMDRIKESPRTVSALIIILIVAAAIYAFSGDGEPSPSPTTGEEAAVTEQTGGPEEMVGKTAAPTEAAVATAAPERAAVPQEQLQMEAQKLPEPRRTQDAYVEVAQAGDGLTHLSRRALTRYLAENQTDYAITNEHRIYIEDYVQNRLGTRGLALGEEQPISFELIREAVNAAKELNENELQNLGQYTHVLT